MALALYNWLKIYILTQTFIHMDIGESEIKKFSIILLIVLVGVLSFYLIKPVLFAVIGGLILAYILNPIYKRIVRVVRNRTLAAFIMLALVVLVIIIPIWFITPLVIQQVFEIFRASQTLDVQKFVNALFPTSSEAFTTQLTVTVGTVISKLSSSVLNSLVNLFLDLPTIVINLFLAGFVLFYALRDSESLAQFASGVSPLNKSKEKILVEQFKGITDSIVYGLFIVGLIQGILAGIGLLIFRVDNALVLTILAAFFSVIPILGPYVVWVPVTVFLFASGNTGVAIAYLAYNAIIVSSMDNILRSYIVSRKTNISPAIILVGMLGGVFVFGIMGLLLGPLILAYFLIILRSYKDKNLYSLFSEESIKTGN